jgi:hypothetical protein
MIGNTPDPGNVGGPTISLAWNPLNLPVPLENTQMPCGSEAAVSPRRRSSRSALKAYNSNV